MVDLVGIDVYIAIFILVKLLISNAFYAISVQLWTTKPNALQYTLSATQS